MIIIVTGSVGSGKTTISKELAGKLKAKYLDVNNFIKDNKLRGKYIKKLDTYEVDVKKLVKLLIKVIKNSKNSLVIDSHLSHYIPKIYVDYCVVCECDLKVLKKRLKERSYSDVKIKENLDSQIFDVCKIEAIEEGHNLIVIDTTRDNVNKCVKKIIKLVL
ncbi:MAG TPA: adenylate kinase family protein [Candidatus Nanoarchaeia archaeon]|nr:adenylate kinase family protein [Candidatus Nanoarchaeia archaeon]